VQGQLIHLSIICIMAGLAGSPPPPPQSDLELLWLISPSLRLEIREVLGTIRFPPTTARHPLAKDTFEIDLKDERLCQAPTDELTAK
jgi:hypothetical protein